MAAEKKLLLAILVLPALAQAEIYRWVDRETGAVKFSNTPPPWYGDPLQERRNPPVEVIRYRGPVEKPKPKPAPAPQAAPTEALAIATLEARWLELVRFFAALPPTTDPERSSPGIRQQFDAYHALSQELDRLDPGGTARRRAQEAAVIDSVRRGVSSELSPPAPAR